MPRKKQVAATWSVQFSSALWGVVVEAGLRVGGDGGLLRGIGDGRKLTAYDEEGRERPALESHGGGFGDRGDLGRKFGKKEQGRRRNEMRWKVYRLAGAKAQAPDLEIRRLIKVANTRVSITHV